MYNHNKAQQSKNRVHISWDILYITQVVMNENPSVRLRRTGRQWGHDCWQEATSREANFLYVSYLVYEVLRDLEERQLTQ